MNFNFNKYNSLKYFLEKGDKNCSHWLLDKESLKEEYQDPKTRTQIPYFFEKFILSKVWFIKYKSKSNRIPKEFCLTYKSIYLSGLNNTGLNIPSIKTWDKWEELSKQNLFATADLSKEGLKEKFKEIDWELYKDDLLLLIFFEDENKKPSCQIYHCPGEVRNKEILFEDFKEFFKANSLIFH